MVLLYYLMIGPMPVVCPQLPSSAECHRNYRQLEAIRRSLKCWEDWERCPVDPSLLDGVERNRSIWWWASRLQDVTETDKDRELFQEWIIEAIGETAFRNGWMPPLPPNWPSVIPKQLRE